ncbi:MAG: hypothetical protein O2794_00485 [bacterium]|nr:hypothetical protein [bacterium]
MKKTAWSSSELPRGSAAVRQTIQLRARVEELEADVRDLEERNKRQSEEIERYESCEEYLMFENRVLIELIHGAIRGEIPKDTVPEECTRPTRKDLSVQNYQLREIILTAMRKPIS